MHNANEGNPGRRGLPNWQVVVASIFIAIPSLDEDDLLNTIESIYSNAAHPDKVYVGISNQRTDGAFQDFSKYTNVKSINTHTNVLRGLGFQFAEASMLWNGQDFFMRLDAHMRMEKNWDRKLVLAYTYLNRAYCKIIISNRTPWFEKLNDGTEVFHDSLANPLGYDAESVEYIKNITEYTEDMTSPRADSGEWGDLPYYVRHMFISGHFFFTTGEFVKDVFPDHRVVFFGEEHTIPIRAWTRGYRIFAIKEKIAYHLGKNEKYLSGPGVDDWKSRIQRYDEGGIHITSAYREFARHYRSVLSANEIGYFGAETLDSFIEYCGEIGLDYRSCFE